MSQKEKARFRSSEKWKKFISYIKRLRKVDEITLKPLRAGATCHHLDTREIHYTNIEDESRFMMLNRQSHDMLHWIYRYYIKDKKIIDRLKTALELMIKYSED